MCVCMFVCELSLKPIFTKFLCALPMAVARFPSGVVVIPVRYVIPVLWMKSCLHIMAMDMCHEKGVYLTDCSMDMTPQHILILTHQGVSPYRGAECDI